MSVHSIVRLHMYSEEKCLFTFYCVFNFYVISGNFLVILRWTKVVGISFNVKLILLKTSEKKMIYW